MIMLLLICVINCFVSWWNARITGSCWNDAHQTGGMAKLLVWCGAVQAAIGFTMVTLLMECGLLALFTDVGHKVLTQIMAVGYLGLIFPLLGTGLIIAIHSWMEAYKRRDTASITAAGYNTVAMGHNISGLNTGIAGSFDAIGDMFSDDDGWILALVVSIVAIAFLTGVVLTFWLIQYYAEHLPMLVDVEDPPPTS